MRRVVIAMVLLLGALGFSSPSGAAVPGFSFTETGCEGHSDAVPRLYTAAFGRTPELDGFNFWVEAYSSAQWSLPNMAAFFVESTEFNTRFGAIDNEGFVTQLYMNVLDRGPDAGGLDFWTQQLTDGLSRGDLLLRFSESPENVTNSGTTAPILGPFNAGLTTPFDCDNADVIELCNAFLGYLQNGDVVAVAAALGSNAPIGVLAALDVLQDPDADFFDEILPADESLRGYVVPICRDRWDRDLVPATNEGSVPGTFFDAVVAGDEAAVEAIAADDVRAVFEPWTPIADDPDLGAPTLSLLDNGTNDFAMNLGSTINAVCTVAGGVVTSCSFGE